LSSSILKPFKTAGAIKSTPKNSVMPMKCALPRNRVLDCVTEGEAASGTASVEISAGAFISFNPEARLRAQLSPVVSIAKTPYAQERQHFAQRSRGLVFP
jgi:hypothetical protein